MRPRRSPPFTTMSLTLVVLAAGMGSRYGGLKQIEPVGPAGETLLDYAVFDARRAGFTRVVFVIRGEFEARFRATIGARYAGQMDVAYARQSLDRLPPGFAPPPERAKPWGTGHAVWCAREVVRGNFVVINADDFYGADSFARLAGFLAGSAAGQTPPQFAMVGFRLANTLSEHGAVARGVCTARADGRLESITEQTGITPSDVGPGRKYTGDEIVSMNCWGFTPALFAGLDAGLRDFLAAHHNDPKTEFYLPAAVAAMITRSAATVRVLPTEGVWFGVTYREERPQVQAAIAGLVAAGAYPPRLWPAPATGPA